MKIGIYVGSFNPVHKGHKAIIDYLLKEKYIDKIIVIPTVNYWDKTDLIEMKDRIKMLKFYESTNIKIMKSIHPYTYLILEDLKKLYPSDTLYLIIGADNLEKFHLWKNIEQILNHKLIVIPRNGINIKEKTKKFQKKENFIEVKTFNCFDISSTEIRDLLNKKEEDKVKKIIDKEVYNYIKKHNLYKN